QEGDHRQHHRNHQSLRDELGHRRLECERATQVTLYQVGDPVQVLLPDRAVETVQLPQRLSVLFRYDLPLATQVGYQRGDIVAGWEVDDDEDDEGDRQEGRDHVKYPTQQKLQHGPYPPGVRVSCFIEELMLRRSRRCTTAPGWP